ncbi:hypothetical protein WA026_014293 [Henosepilachna vigintioctopunctata]|uniref:Uncharacterized protein n=1 Tax=Henosepilachna vigintioctopunctata TaxID=420089 RepID=A0AAW1TUM2_9CUCU
MADLYIMDRSEYILKRMVLLRNWEAPTISDARRNFGDDLAEKIFCNCDDSFKEDFGLEPPLKGPMGKDLWSSPSDLLIGKVCLKPPFTSKHIRALTHQGILKIGLKIEKLFWNQMEIEKSKELEEQERTLKLLCETAKREAIANTRNVMIDNFRSERLDIVTEMENIFKEELQKMEDEYFDKIREKLKEQAETLKQYYEALLEEERLKNNEIVSHNSSVDLDEIEKTLQTAFQTYLQKAQILANFKIQVEQARCKEKLKSLRHELECKNLANLMYVMCMERKKCNYENSLVKTELAKEIHTLSDLLQDKDKEAEKLVTEKNDLQKNVDLRESALSKVMTEFQKFIYFALKAEPKQAEYLLSGEKLLLLELANELSKSTN